MIQFFYGRKCNYNVISTCFAMRFNNIVWNQQLHQIDDAVQWIRYNKGDSIPQTISKVHACMYFDISKFGFPASLSKFSSIMLVLSLKIGTNDCRIFKLNVGFNSLRIGLQNAPAFLFCNGKQTEVIACFFDDFE